MSFSSLGLIEPLLRVVGERNYFEPTPIQTAAIPAVLRGSDVQASAQTGSGKTAAFALPILQRLAAGHRERGRFVRALILVPTRELAAQIGESFRVYARYLPVPIKTLVVYGGVSINPQMMALGGGADVIVATPGRLLDLIDHNAVSLSAVSTLVLDEADQLFSLGFANELNRILALRGYIRVLALANMKADKRAQLYRDAMGMAQRTEEKRAVLAGLADPTNILWSPRDMDKAIDYLRKKGLAASANKASRIASEGIVESYISYLRRKIDVEEPALIRRFGRPYRKYLRTVPRWFPRIPRE